MLRLFRQIVLLALTIAVLAVLSTFPEITNWSRPYLRDWLAWKWCRHAAFAGTGFLLLFYLFLLVMSFRPRRPGRELVLASPDGEIRLDGASLEQALAGRLAEEENVKRARIRLDLPAAGQRGNLVVEATISIRDTARLAHTQARARQIVKGTLPQLILSHRPVKINVRVDDLGRFAGGGGAPAAPAAPAMDNEAAEREMRKIFNQDEPVGGDGLSPAAPKEEQ